jgi:hypothetical protein
VELHPWMTAKGALNEPAKAGALKEER